MTSVFSARLHDAAQWYHDVTIRLQEATGSSELMLHVHAGLAIWLLVSVTTVRWRGGWLPLAMVTAAALLNEVLDWIQAGKFADDTLTDILATVGWPFLITMGGRLGHQSLTSRAPLTTTTPDTLP